MTTTTTTASQELSSETPLHSRLRETAPSAAPVLGESESAPHADPIRPRPAIGITAFATEVIGEALLLQMIGVPPLIALIGRLLICGVRSLHVYRTAHEEESHVNLWEIVLFGVIVAGLQCACHAVEMGGIPGLGGHAVAAGH